MLLGEKARCKMPEDRFVQRIDFEVSPLFLSGHRVMLGVQVLQNKVDIV